MNLSFNNYKTFSVHIDDIVKDTYRSIKKQFTISADPYYKSFDDIDFDKIYTDEKIKATVYYKRCVANKDKLLPTMQQRFQQFKKLGKIKAQTIFNFEQTIIFQFQNYLDIYRKIKSGVTIDPIELLLDNRNKLYLYDGIHRYIMYKKFAKKTVPAIIKVVLPLNAPLDILQQVDRVVTTDKKLPESKQTLIFIDKYGNLQMLNKQGATYRVAYRDQEWSAFKNRIPAKPYQLINHPDLLSKSGHRNDSRLQLIQQCMSKLKNVKTGLDVGASYGMFSRFFDSKGVKMDAIELDKNVAYCAEYLNTFFNTNVKYHRQDVSTWVSSNGHKSYDIIVCLSIIHNIMQAGHTKLALHILKKLSTMGRYMIFDIGEEGEKGDKVTSLHMRLSKKNLHAFITTHTVYKNVVLLGTETGYCNRNLYLLC